MKPALFPFAEYWWLYLAFTGLVVVLLAIDLAFHRKERPISFRNAATWTAVWIALALDHIQPSGGVIAHGSV